MKHILVAGLINMETTVRIDGFPLTYFPVRYPFHGVKSSVSGVGYNVASALTRLGTKVNFLSLIGKDAIGEIVGGTLDKAGISDECVLRLLSETPQSVILYDAEGKRQIHVDLKDIQEATYPEESFKKALQGVSLAALCNINFTRPFLKPVRRRGVMIATDVHAISSLDDAYNLDYLNAADILFASDEALGRSPEDWAAEVLARFPAKIVVVGLGKKGALLATRPSGNMERNMERLPAVSTRPVINTIGAGDALFSAFLHSFSAGLPPREALQRAIVFASWKIGETGAAAGFLSEAELIDLEHRTHD
ncbi:MAG: carbohydrate kinase family protein [Candidatus Ozemobacteraceae bacterium]